MAYCRNCGADIGDAKFCPNCGTPQFITAPAEASPEPTPEPITNYRLQFKRFSGGAPLVKTKILLDGRNVGSIDEGRSLEVVATRGLHQLEMQASLNPKMTCIINVDGDSETVYLPFKLSAMGKPVLLPDAIAATRSASAAVKQKEYTTVNNSSGQKKGSYQAPTPQVVNVNVKQQKKPGCLVALLAIIAVAAIWLNIDSLLDLNTGSTPKPSNSGGLTEAQTTLDLGETLHFGDLDVTVNNYMFSDKIGNEPGAPAPEAGNRWLVADVTMKNTGKQTYELRTDLLGPSLNYTFTLYYDTDYTYHTKWFDYSFCLQAKHDLAPLESVTATINFEVPSEVEANTDKPLVITFADNKSGATEYKWPLR